MARRPSLLAALLLGIVSARHAASESVVEVVPSALVPGPVRTVVLLPPSYRSAPAKSYPVLYFLHDAQGGEDVLEKHGIADQLLAAMREGRIPELLVVSPRGKGTWFIDSWDGRVRYGSFLAKELVPFVESRHRTLPVHGVAGISMGGYGALHWALTEPRLFRVAAVLSPAVQQLDWRMLEPLPFYARLAMTRVFGKSEERNVFHQRDLYRLLLDDPTLAARAPEVLARCGSEDKYRLHQATAFFGRFLSALGVKNRVEIDPGAHDWTYWKRVLPGLLFDAASRLREPSHNGGR